MKNRSFVIKFLMAAITCLIFASCTDLIVSVQPDEKWSGLYSGKIGLNYRGMDYSEAPSPNGTQTRHIVDAQNIYYEAIQDSINRTFKDRVTIYLYNHDEAKDMIGTNGGGHALPKFNTYYYTFIDSNRSITDHFGVVDPYIGAHELVHVITHRTLGYPKTKLMSEGYAVWLDGTYARFHINDIIRSYRDQADKILTPDNLLFNADEYVSSVYYPNCGVFVRFLVHRHGIEIANSLFTESENTFRSQYESLTGNSWQELCTVYTVYLENL